MLLQLGGGLAFHQATPLSTTKQLLSPPTEWGDSDLPTASGNTPKIRPQWRPLVSSPGRTVPVTLLAPAEPPMSSEPQPPGSEGHRLFPRVGTPQEGPWSPPRAVAAAPRPSQVHLRTASAAPAACPQIARRPGPSLPGATPGDRGRPSRGGLRVPDSLATVLLSP